VNFDMRDILQEVVVLISVGAKDKNLQVHLNYTSNLPTNFYGDPFRIRQIVVNLMSNAIKFTESGDVTIQAEGFCEADNNQWQISIRIKDTGIGIPADKISSVFEKFTQADSSTTRKYGGSGLGLTISRGLAEKMGGTLTVSSEIGKGAEFTLTLPLTLYSTGSGAIYRREIAHVDGQPGNAKNSFERVSATGHGLKQ
jgi:signal transduction histidine kinase